MFFICFCICDSEGTKCVNPHGVQLPIPMHVVDEVLLGERVGAVVSQRQLHLRILHCIFLYLSLTGYKIFDLVNQREGIYRVWLVPRLVRQPVSVSQQYYRYF